MEESVVCKDLSVTVLASEFRKRRFKKNPTPVVFLEGFGFLDNFSMNKQLVSLLVDLAN